MSYIRLGSIVTECPELLSFWDTDKNIGLSPLDLSAGSNKSIWWKCTENHSWQSSPKRMRISKSCPYCSGGRILPGFNDLLTINPELEAEWDYTANKGIDPHSIGPNSNKKVAWICKKGHHWNAVVSQRNKGIGCPVCVNKQIVAGVNDFASVHPELVPEWDYKKNKGISPEQVPPSGSQRIWWICPKGHKYQATLNKRHNGTGCPFCNQSRLLSGFNDLQTLYPEIAASWDYEKNGNLRPNKITAHNNKRCWWKCAQGHTWITSVDNRTKGKGCPYCSGRLILAGENDFFTLHPDIVTEWDYEKNIIDPTTIGGKSLVNVWWRCQICGNSWYASVSNRVAGTGCPKCAKRTHSSFPEQTLFYYIHQAYPDSVNGYKELFDNQMELDIYIPSEKKAIEYDGRAWHKGDRSREKELIKYKKCIENGIKLIRIKKKILEGDDETCDELIKSNYDYNHYKTLHDVLNVIKRLLPLISDFDVERDRNIIWDGYYSSLKVTVQNPL